VPHLTAISGGGSYNFTYATGALQSPFDGSSFGTATTLTAVSWGAFPNNPYIFQYAPGTAELTKLTTVFICVGPTPNAVS
jgi:hypothetical protein